MVDLIINDSPTSMSPDSAISIATTPDDESNKLNNGILIFSNDSSSDSSVDVAVLEKKRQSIVSFFEPEILDVLQGQHSQLLKQLLSPNGGLIKNMIEPNETAETRPLHGTTLYIAKCNVDVRSFVIVE